MECTLSSCVTSHNSLRISASNPLLSMLASQGRLSDLRKPKDASLKHGSEKSLITASILLENRLHYVHLRFYLTRRNSIPGIFLCSMKSSTISWSFSVMMCVSWKWDVFLYTVIWCMLISLCGYKIKFNIADCCHVLMWLDNYAYITCRWVSPVGDTNKEGSTQVCACVCVYVHVCVQCQLSNATCTSRHAQVY